MAPKKRTNSGGKKSTLQNREPLQPSQPSKYGIQHFFERHSQSQKTLSEDGKKGKINNPLKPISSSATITDRKPRIVPRALESRNLGNGLDDAEAAAINVGGAANSVKIESNCKRLRNGNGGNTVNSAESCTRSDFSRDAIPVPATSPSGLDSEVMGLGNATGGNLPTIEASNQARSKITENSSLVVIYNDEVQSEVSPEATKSISVNKRFKFSPGMLIKQSQDDTADEVTWKISPINEKLHSMSKGLPGMIRVLADSSRFNSMNFQQCSQKKVQTSPGISGKFEKWLSSPPPKADEKSLICLNSVSSKTINKHDDVHHHGNNKNTHSIVTSQVLNSPSPFSTPPSLSCCHAKALDDVDSNGASDQLGSRQHQKALIELLDQVEDVISVEHPLSTPKFLVLEVAEKHGSCMSSGSASPFKMLRLLNEQSGAERALLLWDEWYFSVVAPGDIIHVIGEFDSEGKCDVNHEKNFLIVNPDILVSGTQVSSSFSCPRRTILGERLKRSEHSVPALIGTLLHQIFQAALLREFPTNQFLEEYTRTVIQKNLESIYACGAKELDIQKTLFEAIPKILNWISCFRDSQGSKNPSIDFKCEEGLKKIKISEVIDIEEMVWAPKYGLKGTIDASVRVRTKTNSGDSTEMIMPLEFKTGKGTSGQTAMEHNAQVMLYTLLMSERYLTKIGYGLLYYLHTEHTQGISVRRSDLIGLIMRRNELANDISKASTTQQLPPMLQSPNMCKGCRLLDVCTVYHQAYGGTTEGSGLGDIYDSLVSHLTTTHIGFLRKWERLIDLEAKHLEVVKKEFWGSEKLRNDQASVGIPSLVLDISDKPSQNKIMGGNRFVYRFVPQDFTLIDKEQTNEDALNSSSSPDHVFRSGDYVILSTEPDHLRVAKGVIVDIGNSHVSVSFAKLLRLPGRNSGAKAGNLHKQSWRIDKDETVASFAIMRYNIIQLFLQNETSSHLRKMTVDLEMPRFDSGGIFSQDPAVSYVWSQKSLNDDQRRAILKILTAKDYALILGMPGTGKTSTMVHAVKALLMRGSSILLTSYTNSAVDNLLVKLKAQGIDFIRIGRYDAVLEEIQENCLSAMNMNSTEEIKQKLDTVNVVAVTCLGITSPLLTNKRFDICIMDEAGQITLPVSMGPLAFASKFVLVGDHYQLPPLVQSPEAKENGMSASLFCRLSETHPQAIAALHYQYRMCASIMELSNALIYGNRLRCVSPEVENAKLAYKVSASAPVWLMEVLNPNQPVIFVNTDMLPAYGTSKCKAVNNPIEAYIIAEVTKALLLRGIQGQDIGIITPYNAQANLIRGAVSENVEIHTIDKYQGRDKDCILVSFVRSCENARINSSSLLGDWHRINVALTRAKKKLIMVGSCATLSKVPLLKLLIEKVEELSGMMAVSKKEINYKTEMKRCSQFR